ncbi:FMN-binding negative transcriptional regulator [Gephyromycinifex aptenodytis]|uniref:FMN-binding negative transcriptional regulator n=1 Tax=Gephyromycinifex aptenodytis TaxID=2716227 RepID=UPI001448932A|nr:FMN-binding negative transcriptional regulator [Gephyromycinifex aptenodytis]
MHVYPEFAAPCGTHIVQFAREHPFGLLATSRADAPPLVTHIPVVLPDLPEGTETLVGQRLVAHMGRENPHWQHLESGESLLVLTSSHGYVSPVHYQREVAVPTVDYAAVHLTVRARLLPDEQDRLAVVEATVQRLERDRCPRWDPTSSRGQFRQIIGGVAAFELEVVAQEAMFKLSQDKPQEARLRLRAEFAAAGCPHNDLAELIDRVPVNGPQA